MAAGPSPIRPLELVALRRLDGLLQGDYRGLFPGLGSEWSDARTYVPGDDPRRIDWPVTARTGETMVRDTIVDHELELWLVVDTSASLAFGTGRAEKAAVARDIAGTLGLVAARGGNRVGCMTAGSGVVVPARSGRAHLAAVLAALDRPADGAKDALASTLSSLGRLAVRPAMVVVISDLLASDGWPRAMRALAARHDVIAVEVVDGRELALPDVGFVQLVDPESGRRRVVDTRDQRVRADYAIAAHEQRVRIASEIRSAGAHHLRVRTDGDWIADLVRFVITRRQQQLASNGAR
ncbi:MAG TPA: DUF58 domain-containing protein [Acidimicrobiales bacterium]|nr:DUF58 domain-containing protein [Acidimicrobiales bacterium]